MGGPSSIEKVVGMLQDLCTGGLVLMVSGTSAYSGGKEVVGVTTVWC